LLSPGFGREVAGRRADARIEGPPGAEAAGALRAAHPLKPVSPARESPRVNITEKTDEEILAVAGPLWRDLVKSSNDGKYGEFARNFSSSLALAMNQVVAGHQFANSELARSLSEEVDTLGIIRRGEHATVLFRQRSTKKPGEWLGRLVLGYEDGKVRIFGASLF
jgi:hypothetical protein